MTKTKLCPHCSTEKDVSEFGKNKTHKDGLSWYCKPCNRSKHKEHREANKEVLKKRKAEFHLKNKETIAAWRKTWYKTNRARELNRVKEYYEENKDSVNAYKQSYRLNNREKILEAKQQWADNNRDIYRASKARRRAYKLLATPTWANKGLIVQYYELALAKSEETGVEWHVDHIVPLKSLIVCGLHWEGNLQVLPGAENSSKGNRYWPDMP